MIGRGTPLSPLRLQDLPQAITELLRRTGPVRATFTGAELIPAAALQICPA